eukprot:g23266.t1
MACAAVQDGLCVHEQHKLVDKVMFQLYELQDRAITAERRAANLEAALKKVRRQLRLRKEWAISIPTIAAAEARQGARLAKLAEGYLRNSNRLRRMACAADMSLSSYEQHKLVDKVMIKLYELQASTLECVCVSGCRLPGVLAVVGPVFSRLLARSNCSGRGDPAHASTQTGLLPQGAPFSGYAAPAPVPVPELPVWHPDARWPAAAPVPAGPMPLRCTVSADVTTCQWKAPNCASFSPVTRM